MTAFAGSDMVSLAEAFRESWVYYQAIHPETDPWPSRAAFIKRVSAQGVPLLVGARPQKWVAG